MIAKVSDIVNAADGLKEVVNLDFTAVTAMKIARIARVIDEENKEFETQRGKLFEKYGSPKEDGNVVVNAENVEKFMEEMNSLLDSELDISVTQLHIDDFGDVEISPAVMVKIMFLISDE